MNELHILSLIFILGIITGSFEGLKHPTKLTLIVIGVLLLVLFMDRKEGFYREEETKVYKIKL
jgi:hypothetical protein